MRARAIPTVVVVRIATATAVLSASAAPTDLPAEPAASAPPVPAWLD